MNMIIEQQGVRLPPQAIEAEQSIIGSMLLDHRNVDTAINWLEQSDFYRMQHGLIFDAIIQLDSESQPADVVTVSEKLSALGTLEQCGGLAYLGELARNTPDAGNIKAYVKIVREQAKYRKIIESSTNAIAQAYEKSGSPEDVVNALALDLDALDKNNSDQNDSGMVELMSLALDGIERRSKSKSKLLGFSTGLVDLDHKMGGLQKQSLVIVAGRPSMGKSCFALNICDEALVKDGAKVKVFSLEMSRSEVSERNLARWAVVDFGRIRNAYNMLSEDWPKLTSAVALFQDKGLSVDDSASLNINQIRARCRYAKRNNGLDIVVIDYLGLMQLRPGVNKTDAIEEVTRALKVMARELDLCVVLLCQLNRSLENRPNKRPVMSDLRDSGAIEQDADQIIFLYRDEVYNPDTKFKGICEVDLAKYRNGETGVVRTIFEGQYQRFKCHNNFYGQEH